MPLANNFCADFYLFFRKTSETEEILKNLSEKEKAEDKFSHIRCPLCGWRPLKTSRWYCADAPENFYYGCRTRWNTFETHGVCPGCGHQWRYTSCLSCHRHSLHEAWYV